ncbi:hypothetical protein DTL21_05685 [Bremerella cremea]|uniref:Uncharacterized protein n=1 Tax=Blastopirellula marina TaxID=124 RepID=A0A2S8FZX3_9BACT|nr:hypothetical protein C5Y83_05685 [Blastopirellula marina]RCS49821.1 hypothetical protein DTL21_05685 [Bremerella cremea]
MGLARVIANDVRKVEEKSHSRFVTYKVGNLRTLGTDRSPNLKADSPTHGRKQYTLERIESFASEGDTMHG